MRFEEALTSIRQGVRVRRSVWESGRFVFMVNGSQFAVNREPLASVLGMGSPVAYQPHIDVHIGKAGGANVVAVWNPAQEDLFGEDWCIEGQPDVSPMDKNANEFLRYAMTHGRFTLGSLVTKIQGSKWSGRVCGFYSTKQTPLGLCVESDHHENAVQIYPETALALLKRA